jgi:hypothetical protein
MVLGSPAKKPDVTTSAPPNKATVPATPYKAPKPINPLISAMNLLYNLNKKNDPGLVRSHPFSINFIQTAIIE